MNLYCGLANEMFKYHYGNFNPWTVPFVQNEHNQFTCAQNDSIVTQLLLYSQEELMVTLDHSPAFYEAYPVHTVRIEVDFDCIPASHVDTHLVELVRDDDGNYKSEVLLSQQRKYNERLKVQPIWIEVHTSPSTPAGSYEGKVRVYHSRLLEDEVLFKELTVTVEVLPIALKSLDQGDFYLDLWQHHTSLARTYEVPLWSDAHFDVMASHLKVLQELGQKAITVIVSDAPWSGQWSTYYRTNPSDYFEYNMISVRKDATGNWHYDFEAMNRYIRLCLAHNIDQEIEIFGLLGIWTMADAGFGAVITDSQDAVRIRYRDEATGTYQYIRSRKDLEGYIRALDENIAINGWAHLAKIVCDEPHDTQAFQETLSTLKTLTPHIQFKVTICSLKVLQANFEGVNDYVVNLPLILSDEERIRQIRQEQDCTMSYYVAIDPKTPNTFLRCHLAESRILPWLSLYMNMDGFLRWAIWLWPNDPYNYDSYHYQKFQAGGTHFVYPSKTGTPLYSLRYKNLKRGIRDYMIFKMYIARTGDQEGVIDAIQSILKVATLEQMQGSHRRNADEIMSLNFRDYDQISVDFLRKLADL
ncbi:MAG: DUF4091 domain-containing protein [Cellulosilyticaceae bacterium]